MKCPVCRAGFRGEPVCSRCGADLEPLMALVMKAYLLRRAAKQALAAGKTARATSLAAAAQETCFTNQGERLRLLTLWLTHRGTGW